MSRLRWVLVGHTVTLLVTLFVAATSYAVLSATTETSRLAVRGTVDESAGTAAYDILVRPPDAVSEAERRSGLVQPGFLGATARGISLDQWRDIEDIRRVEVAAPVAVIGWVVPYVTVPVDLGEVADTTTPVVVRRTTTWSYDNGASQVVTAPSLLYVTPHPLVSDYRRQLWVENKPDGSQVTFPFPSGSFSETVDEPDRTLFAVSTTDLAQTDRAATVIDVPFPFPFLVTAVDPAAEAELSGVEDAVVDGEWLEPGPLGERTFSFSDGQTEERVPVPVVVADAPLMRLDAEHRAEVLDGAAVRAVAAGGLTGPAPASLFTDSGRELTSGSADQDRAYADYLAAMATPRADGEYYARSVIKLHRTSPLEVVTSADGTLVPGPVESDLTGWGNQAAPGDVAEAIVPPGGDDSAFRTLEAFFAAGDPNSLVPIPAPALVRVGVFDADRLPGATSLARVPLGTFAFAAPRGADAASRRTLSDQDWYPATDLAGYLQPPPLMLTTLDALEPFSDVRQWVQPGPGETTYDDAPPVAGPPLSAVRVRVGGVDGVGALDRERVRAVAEEIAESTGLAVDITLGASPGEQRVEVAAGVHGRPQVTVAELWVEKGVAVKLVQQIDRASLLLSLVVLAAAGLVVLDAVYASVRARRREIGILLSLGWSPRQVGSRVLLPVLGSALAAGVGGAAAAYALRRALGLDRDLTGALAAIPVALGVALLAGAWPAVAAARTSPVDAMRPPARRSTRRRLRRVRSVPGIAWGSLTLAPGRTAAATVGIATATAALGSLLAVQAEFQGRAPGTLLGDAIAVQVRTPDLVAALLTMLLAGIGMHHVMATEIRERRAELATLRAVGWPDALVARLLLTQAAMVAALGALVGGVAAWWFLGAVFEVRTPTMLLALLGAGAVAVLIAGLVTLLPVSRLRSVAVGRLLSED